MSYQGRKNTMKNRFSQESLKKQSMTIGEYVERLEERRQYPARIINGVMEVCFMGHYISVEEFDKLVPAPIVHSFAHDISNVDTTRKWLIS